MYRFFSLLAFAFGWATTASACESALDRNFYATASVAEIRSCLRSIEPSRLLTLRDEEGNTPLHLAAAFSSEIEVIPALLALRLNLDERNHNQLTPLHLAARESTSPGMILLLIRLGAKVSPSWTGDPVFWSIPPGRRPSVTPIMHVAQRRDGGANTAAMINTLVVFGDDKNAFNKVGGNALHFAAANSRGPEPIMALLAAGLGNNSRDNMGRTPLLYAASNSSSIEVFRALLAAGADANVTDQEGKTALLYAAAFQISEQIFEVLFEATLDPCVADKSGRTALALAKTNPSLFESRTYSNLREKCKK